MAYDEVLANRLRDVLSSRRGIDEKAMFGGLGFLVGGHLVVAASRDGGLLVRVPPSETETLLDAAGGRGHVTPMVMAGRPRRGWLHVAAEGLNTRRQLTSWVGRALDYVDTLPAKPG
ncbi:TfoX/Sxy family protein [Mycolicibacterium palauense]|uniref:TfoX/Sxy family protein n=1 Tax=Mycolicibacterium palauense TaxID=2034511 RepID=UPI000BFEB299|nr:TfoX/Sxy family protein [Mycolicibacterium palauense]